MKIRLSSLVAGIVLQLSIVGPQAAWAVWPKDPNVNLPVCTAAMTLPLWWGESRVVSDGAGGVIAVWPDYRSGSAFDVYAQHILASGVLDGAWPVDGLAVCLASGDQYFPQLVSDGAGGAIVTWEDHRADSGNIYAQHVLATGNVDPTWPVDGVAICTAAGQQAAPQLVSDGMGGAVLVWRDSRDDVADLYAHHALAGGTVDPSWPSNGVVICNETSYQDWPQLISDGSGGAFITWEDWRAGAANRNIYAHHVLATGTVDSGWDFGGVLICGSTNNQASPQIASDGFGGAIIAWTDASPPAQIYAHHLLASGVTDAAWPTYGLAISSAPYSASDPQLVSDDAGGAIVSWTQNAYAYTPYNPDVYAQHVLAAGVLDSAWPAAGLVACSAVNYQDSPQLVGDGAGGAIVAWDDNRTNAFVADVYAQHVLASGTVDAAWPLDGRAISVATSDQLAPQVVSDGATGVIIVWTDMRSDPSFGDIYAQGIDKSGRLGLGTSLISSVRDVPNDEGGKVKLSWTASSFDMDDSPLVEKYWIYRSAPPNAARQAAGGVQALIPGRGGQRGPIGRFLSTKSAASTIYWEYVQEEDAFHFFDAYSALVPTTGDSMGTGPLNLPTEFMVVALSADSSLYWLSPPASGYSVDNISPPSPGMFRTQVRNDQVELSWDPSSAADIEHYSVYRGADREFAVSAENRIATVEAPEITVPKEGGSVVKVSAVDRHGNEGAPATLELAPGEAGPLAGFVSLEHPVPSPTAGRTRIGFALPRAGNIELEIYDAAGKRIRTLASGPAGAGKLSIDWDLRSDAGREVGAGLYFVRLHAEGRTLTRRLTVLH